MIGLGLLARDPELRRRVLGNDDPAPKLGHCRVVGFNGRSTDYPGGIWGSIAEQLGKADQFARYVSPLLSAPGPEAWKQLLGGDPLVLFLDELPPYLEYAVTVSVGSGDLGVVTTTALANLFVAVAEMNNVCLVLSDLAGTNFSIGQANLQAAFDRAVQGITSESRRIAVPITPVNPNGDELYHILRKRLFENVAPQADIERVAAAYRDALREADRMNLTTTTPESLYTRVIDAYPLVEDEVKRQIASMQALDEDGEPNFNDADYQLAAYAAALKVLTQYGNIDGRDVEHEVFAVRARNEKSDFQAVIERALGIACDTLVPRGLDNSWRDLSLAERYYLRALDIESRGERRKGMYEELARGFGVTDIRPLLKSDKANGARMYTPSGLEASLLAPIGGGVSNDAVLPSRRGRAGAAGPHPFAASPLRHLMFAVRETTAADNSPEPGRQYLRDTFGQGYWTQRERFIGLLEWLAQLGNTAGMDEWRDDSAAARILAGRLRNDHA